MVSGKWKVGNIGKVSPSRAAKPRVAGQSKGPNCGHRTLHSPAPFWPARGGVTGHGVWRPLVSGSRDPVGTLARGVGRPWEGQSEVQTYNWMMNDMPPQLCTRIRERATSNWTRFHSVAEFRQVFKATPLPPPCIDISL